MADGDGTDQGAGGDADAGAGNDGGQGAGAGGDGGQSEGAGAHSTGDLSHLPPEVQTVVKEARREAAAYRRRLRDTEKERDDLKVATQTETERAIAAAVKDERTKWDAEHYSDTVRLRVRAAAAGKFADPADAERFVEIDQFSDVDAAKLDDKIAAAIADVLESKPYLAAGGAGDGGGKGSGDGLRTGGAGARGTGGGKDKDPDAWLRAGVR